MQINNPPFSYLDPLHLLLINVQTSSNRYDVPPLSPEFLFRFRPMLIRENYSTGFVYIVFSVFILPKSYLADGLACRDD